MPPTATLPKIAELGLAANAPEVTPVPERGMWKMGLVPLEMMCRRPLTAPLAVGE